MEVILYGYGNMDMNEYNAMSLNPKFLEFKTIDLEEVEPQHEVRNTKARWNEHEIQNAAEKQSSRVKITMTVKDGKVVTDRPQTFSELGEKNQI